MEYVVFEKNYLFSQKTPLSTSFFIRQTQSKRHKKYRTHFFREKTEKTFLWSLHKVGGDGLDVICERYIIFSNVCTYIRRMHLSIYNDIQISQSFAIPGLTKMSSLSKYCVLSDKWFPFEKHWKTVTSICFCYVAKVDTTFFILAKNTLTSNCACNVKCIMYVPINTYN
jgi:hypothetical protein